MYCVPNSFFVQLKEWASIIYLCINTIIYISTVPPKNHMTYNQVYCGCKCGTNITGKPILWGYIMMKEGKVIIILLEEQYKANGVAILFS